MPATQQKCSDASVKKSDGPLTLLFDESTMKSSGLFGGQPCKIPMLTFLSGESLGKELPLVQQQVTLGRGEESDLLIVDPSVSRKHIRLSCRKLIDKNKREEIKVVLEDLGSKNGTMVNYRKVRRAVLKAGDKIGIGRVILKFDYRDMADQNFFDEIYRLATVDGLTSLHNKTTIMRDLAEEIIKWHRYHRRLSIAIIDIDDFKSLNDTFGHLMGDRTLQTIAEILLKNLRRQDKAGRFGGEEFILVLPETGTRGAVALSERVRRDLEKSVATKLGLPRRVTASFGVVCCGADAADAESMIANADAALYRAKARGKNRVEVWKSGKKAQPRT